jgi:electron transport complex protein RnfC
MIKRPFFSLSAPKLKYPVIESVKNEDIQEIPLPGAITLLFERSRAGDGEPDINTGEQVKTGQKISIAGDSDTGLILTATGTVTDICEYIGYLGKRHISVTIKTTGEDQWDDAFQNAGEAVLLEKPLMFLGSLPGKSDLSSLTSPGNPLDTIIINGIDRDLLVTTNQVAVKIERDDLSLGIQYLKKITNVEKIIITVPFNAAFDRRGIEAEVKAVDPIYPNALPNVIMKKVLGRIVPASKRCEEMGVGFINTEAVAALGRAFRKKKIPVHKILTVIKKDYSRILIKARIGTPIRDILAALNIETNYGDGIVLGGPMTGLSAYSEDIPILWDTDAIMIQDKDQVVIYSDTHCINCGECVRACPSKIPVNMLVRLLENGLYEEAVEEYDLLACIECGLCAYVCVARIPLFHYIMMGKYEFGKMKMLEETDA